MKQLFYGFIVIAMLCLLPALSFSTHRDVNVPTFATSGQYLNQFIAADATGRGTADTTTYILARDQTYYANSYINNVGWTLRMRSSYGRLTGSGTSRSGYPATIFLIVGSSGTQVNDLVQMAGNVWLSNLEISGYDETVTPSALGTIFEEIFLVTAPGFNITVDSCIITNCGQGVLRCNSAPRVVQFTNSTFANLGSRLFSDLGNGRVVDCRTGSVDSLILQNNTIINHQDRIVRHLSSTANIKYMKFDHNTVVNSMSFHGMLSFGHTSGTFSITNNLFVNPWALGDDTDGVRQAEMVDNGENNPLNGLARMTIVNAVPDSTNPVIPAPTTWTIKNNYYRITSTEQTWWTFAGANPVLKLPSPLPWHISKKIGTDSLTAFQVTTTDLNKVPALMTGTMTYYRSPSGANKTKINNTSAPDMDRKDYGWLTDSLDCKYPPGASIYTAATGGQPIGSLMWWNIAVGVEKSNNPVPTGYALTQNYPNPFNPTTNFTYEINKAGFVSIKIYDILGREVATLVNEVKQVGSFTATWNAINAGSGIYFCKMQSGSFTATKKMILMK